MGVGKRRKQYFGGVKAGIPVIFGFVPAGIAFAIVARNAGFGAGETCLMSLTVFAGASQMMAAGMVSQGAGLWSIVLATFILNLRHVIMSTCVMNRLQNGGAAVRMLAAFGVTDESFAIFTTAEEDKCTVWYFLGLITVTYSSWNLGSLIGAVASDILPAVVTASLGIALYAMFVAIVVPGLKGNWRLAVLVVFTGLCNTVFGTFMDSSWALIVSTLLCALAGVFFVDFEEDEGNER